MLTPAYVQLTFNHAPAANADFSSHVNYSKSKLYNLYSNFNAESNLHGTWLCYGLWLLLCTVLRMCGKWILFSDCWHVVEQYLNFAR